MKLSAAPLSVSLDKTTAEEEDEAAAAVEEESSRVTVAVTVGALCAAVGGASS